MELHLQLTGGRDLSGQVYRGISAAIVEGRLKHGQQLPPSRLLAEQLGISRKPVSDAYARLTYDRLVIGHIGKGSFVNSEPRADRAQPHDSALAANARLEYWRAVATPLRSALPKPASRYDFAGGTPAPGHFPHDEWRRCVLHGLRQNNGALGKYGPAEGVPVLRDAIARHIGFSRGVACTGADVIVTNGAQQAFDLLTRVMIAPGDVVAMEEPGYPMARLLFAAYGARVVSVGVDSEGMIVDEIPRDAKMIYTTPAHQFPLGMPMSARRRAALLAKAHAIGALIIEDDYDSEFRYEGRPVASLQSMDRHGVVAFVGTFSKVMLPELRMGFIVAPAALLQPLQTAKHVFDWHSPAAVQYALAHFIDEGLLLKHIRRGHGIYANRRNELLSYFGAALAPWFKVVPNAAGFHVAALPTRPVDIGLLQTMARRVDVGVYALEHFYAERPPQRGLFLGYGSIGTLDIGPALLRVRDILREIAA